LIISISICLTVIGVSLNIFKLPLTGDNFSNRTYGTVFLATLFVMIGLLISANLLLFPKIAEYFPAKALGYIAEHSHPESPEIIAYRYYEPSMVFYSHKRIIQVEKPGELVQLTASGKPFLAYMTLRHFKELPQSIQRDCRVLSYGIRYRNRIRNILDLLKSSSDGTNRELLLIYHPGKKVN
jgi:hypothetical protein